jgi:hypothetical protein
MALDGSGFSLVVRPVASLLPHEQIIPSHVNTIQKELKEDGVQRDPIMIDGSDGVVLDGMHRLAAFEKMGIRNAICCAVDYDSESVSLGRWARAYATRGGEGLEGATGDNWTRRVSTVETALEELGRRGTALAVMSSEGAYLFDGNRSLDEAFEAVRRLDAVADQRGWHRTFVPDDEIVQALRVKGSLAVLVEKLLKGDVLRAGRESKFFPCKTSRHTIDPRPVAVDFPLKDLDRATDEALRRRLSGSRGRLLPANSVYGGRRYKERLLVLIAT